MRIVLIDNNSGYIFGDSADLDGRIFTWDDVYDPFRSRYPGRVTLTADDFALAFAQAFDRSIGETGRAYRMAGSDPASNETGYHVYRIDVDGSHVIGDVHDGQDREIIDAVTTGGRYLGFIATVGA